MGSHSSLAAVIEEARPAAVSAPALYNAPGVSAKYRQLIEDGGTPHAAAVPKLLELLGPVRQQRVLDLCTGQGLMAQVVARLGAESVVGVDIADDQIQMAIEAEREDPLGVHYLCADARSLQRLPGRLPQRFHAITCCLALQDIQDLGPMYATASRFLLAGGRFVAAFLHPCAPHSTASGGIAWSEHSYYNSGYRWRSDNQYSVSSLIDRFHHLFEDHWIAADPTGLVCVSLREPRPPESLVARAPQTAEHPHMVVACWRKPRRKDW